jgi:hypothetical protein
MGCQPGPADAEIESDGTAWADFIGVRFAGRMIDGRQKRLLAGRPTGTVGRLTGDDNR